MLKAAKIISVTAAILMTVVLVSWQTDTKILPFPWSEDLAMLILIFQPVAAGFNFYIAKRTKGGWKRFAFVYTVMIVLIIFAFVALVFGAPIPDHFG